MLASLGSWKWPKRRRGIPFTWAVIPRTPYQITSLTVVYSTVYSDADQRKHQSSTSLAFVRGIHRGPVNSPNKWPVTRKMFPLDDVTMIQKIHTNHWYVGRYREDRNMLMNGYVFTEIWPQETHSWRWLCLLCTPQTNAHWMIIYGYLWDVVEI